MPPKPLGYSTHSTDQVNDNKKASMRVEIPKNSFNFSETETLRTPKTPQNEGIIWFESDTGKEPVQVYEVVLEADGGPNKDRAVSGPRRIRCRAPYQSCFDSTRVFLLPLRPTSCASPSRLAPLRRRVAFSRQISRSMEVHLSAIVLSRRCQCASRAVMQRDATRY